MVEAELIGAPSSVLDTDLILACRACAVRLWGWKENGIEVARDEGELGALAKAGKPLYGKSDLPEYVQGVAHRNSLWSKSTHFNLSSSLWLCSTLISLSRSTQVWRPALVSSKRCETRGDWPARLS